MSRRRAVASVLTAALGLAAGAAGVVAPASAAAGYAVEPLTFEVAVGPGRDTRCRIDADLYLPDTASRTSRVPAILATNGFGGDKTGLATIAAAYAQRGYAFLAYSGLGFGASSCRITLDDPDWDGEAASQLISFLGGGTTSTSGRRLDVVVLDRRAHDGRRYAHDPRVGMLNGSYGGAVQLAAAAQDPRLDAIAPLDTWNDLAYSLAPNDTDVVEGVTSATPGVLKATWATAFAAVGALQAAGGEPTRQGTCPGFDAWVCPALAHALVTGYPDAGTRERLAHASVRSYVSRIRIPTLIVQGQHDTLFTLRESIATYRALRAQGTPVRLVWASAGHSGGSLGTAEYDPARPEAAYHSRLELEWFDWYLRGAGRPPALDFAYFRDWVPYSGDAEPAVAHAPGYPVGDERTLALSADGTLVEPRVRARPGSMPLLASVSYTSRPLEQAVDVVGVPRLRLRIDARTFAATQARGPDGQLVLFAALQDVDPSGEATTPQDVVAAIRVPDVTRPVAIELPAVVHRFAAGHRLRVTLSRTDPAFRAGTLQGPVAVVTDDRASSALSIPVVG